MPSKPLVLPNEFILLTMLLCLVSILNNNDGDILMHNYAEIKKTRYTASTDLEESEFEALNSMSAVLVRDCEVVSSSYNDGLRCNVIVLADHQECRNGLDDPHDPTVDGQDPNSYINMILPPKFATMGKPDPWRVQAGSEYFGVRIAKEGKGIWSSI